MRVKAVAKRCAFALTCLGAASACTTQARDTGNHARTVASSSPAVAREAYCSLDMAPAVPCSVTDTVDADYVHAMRFEFPGHVVRFEGKSQTGWWSGKLDGKPAMGYELNRGHTVYSTVDLGTRFEWWTPGMQHGNY